jgi:3-oxoacyl-[acyl-carrier-protein] synthase II
VANFHETQPQRVVITGYGAVTPLGADASTTWTRLVAGESGVTPVDAFDVSDLPTKVAGSVRVFDATRYMNPREARRTPRFMQFALAAAQEAIAHAGLSLEAEDHTRVGIELGSALGGLAVIEEQSQVLATRGPGHINPALVPMALASAPACMLSIHLGVHGPVNTPIAACATGILAIVAAGQALCSGRADVVLAGGTDSGLTRLALGGFGRLGASTTGPLEEQRCAPFDAHRNGTVIGEGAALLVVETLAHAQARGAHILAEVLGFGLTADAYQWAAPDPSGHSAARAMIEAIQASGLTPDDIAWICAHGTGTLLNDPAETEAVKQALGDAAPRVPVVSNKGALGHMMGAAGAVSAVTAIQSMHAGCIPPTINYHTPDPACDLDYVPNAGRAARVDTVLVNAFGLGGQNASLVLRKWASNGAGMPGASA